MSLSTQPIKGARDFYPEDMRLEKYIFAKWREVNERFGYEEYDAPILEPTDLYLSKGNEEIVTEQTYSFEDRGGRKVTMRTEMTPTVSRMVAARRQELAYPLRWYSIPQCWRYERMQRGRGREFYQLNVDLFGIEGLQAEYEIINNADAVMQAFGAERSMYTIKLNSRKLVDFVLKDWLGLDATQAATLTKLIDRMAKMERGEFLGKLEALFSPSQREAGAQSQLQSFLEVSKLEALPDELKKRKEVAELSALMSMLAEDGISNLVFDPSLMRGFDYYTDIVFEVFDNDPANNRSMFGGGRYDGLLTLFGAEALPVVGYGMGDITLANFLETHGLLPSLDSETSVYIVTIGSVEREAQKVAKQLRDMGLDVAIDTTGRKPDKQIKAAVKKGIRYAMFVGEKELASGQFVMRDLQTSQEETHGLERLVSLVKDYRSRP
ncbi:MAG TPA: histidine--tRNA ligase [Patescibacteria group bacterium]|nr:histidine--tRNA ligase [Patescibacteria group bacterium]